MVIELASICLHATICTFKHEECLLRPLRKHIRFWAIPDQYSGGPENVVILIIRLFIVPGKVVILIIRLFIVPGKVVILIIRLFILSASLLCLLPFVSVET